MVHARSCCGRRAAGGTLLRLLAVVALCFAACGVRHSVTPLAFVAPRGEPNAAERVMAAPAGLATALALAHAQPAVAGEPSIFEKPLFEGGPNTYDVFALVFALALILYPRKTT
mmetsp:Transcript_41721/g.115045  ORF Transcript_41721/g.115045 Transcript_41721/m.115045 type:complete len:114 (-) Transcript_41721:55-396(-)